MTVAESVANEPCPRPYAPGKADWENEADHRHPHQSSRCPTQTASIGAPHGSVRILIITRLARVMPKTAGTVGREPRMLFP